MNTPNPYAPPQAAVADIAAPGGAEKGGRGTRLVAAIVDGFVAMAMIYVPLLIGGGMSGAFNMAGSGNSVAFMTALMTGGGVFALIGFLAWCVITYMLVKRNGQTIAKKWMGIKVVRADGSPASVGRIFWLRNFVNGILGIIPLYGIIDLLWIFGEESRCLHDKIADTIVIKA